MKRIIALTIICIVTLLGFAKKDDNRTEAAESLMGESVVEDITSIMEESLVEETISADSISEDRVAIDISDIDCADEEIMNAIETECTISASEDIEYTGWVDDNKNVFRIALKRHTPVENEYLHLKDYFIIKKDGVQTLLVDYSSDLDGDRHVFDACDFCAEYIDVNFDNNKDLVISLGHEGSHAYKKYCAYLYEEGEYQYEKSFEEIPNFEINSEEKVITGSYISGVESCYIKYMYQDGAFVEITEDCFEKSTSN